MEGCAPPQFRILGGSVAKFIFSYVVGCKKKKLCLRGVRCRKNKMLIFEYEMIGIVTVKIFLEMRLSEIILILGQRVL